MLLVRRQNNNLLPPFMNQRSMVAVFEALLGTDHREVETAFKFNEF